MIKKSFIAISVLIILITLTLAAPVSAFGYSVSLTTYPDQPLSSSKAALLQNYKIDKISGSSLLSSEFSKVSSLNAIQQATTRSSIGSASAFSKLSQMQQLDDGSFSKLEFSQSVSVIGDITQFSFTTDFGSSISL